MLSRKNEPLWSAGQLSAPRIEDNRAAMAAQALFLDAAILVNPSVIKTLRADVLPLFQAAASSGRGDLQSTALDWSLLQRMAVNDEQLQRLLTALEAWCNRWNLREVAENRQGWIERTALSTLMAWHEQQLNDAEIKLQWDRPTVAIGFPTVPPDPDERDYFPWLETRTQYLNRKTKAARARIAAVEAFYREAGWSLGPKKTSSVHFHWLVKYQTAKRSLGEIAKGSKPAVTEQRVADAIKRTAATIRLQLRPALKGGRKPSRLPARKRS